MWQHSELDAAAVRAMIRKQQVTIGGNNRLKIYGKLSCASGKRVKRENRVFFTNELAAIHAGYRPCGHCMPQAYKKWKERKMNLFDNAPVQNLLPYDGVVEYYGVVINSAAADAYLQRLLQEIAWRHDEAVIFGRHIVTARKVAWYGDAGYDYTYSNTTKRALPWTEDLLQLKNLVEQMTGETYNSCLLNLYHNGNEGMAWHSDDEKMLAKDGAIASLSFGAERKFSFRHRDTKETLAMMLQHGSLLVMKGVTQTHWLHSLPKSKKVTMPRINLTFRKMVVQ
jgi:alkylated DNA repair dioxygenase AlkB